MEQGPNLTPKIEILGPEQWQEYREIRLKALKTDPTAFGQSYDREVQKTEEQIKNLLSDPNSRTYVTKIGDKIVSMVTYDLVLPENVEHMAKISSVFTDPDFRRQGVGEKLLAHVLDDLHKNPKTSRVILSVGVLNEGARNMYKKLGFVDFGIGRKEIKVQGKYYDQAQMELIFEDKL